VGGNSTEHVWCAPLAASRAVRLATVERRGVRGRRAPRLSPRFHGADTDVMVLRWLVLIAAAVDLSSAALSTVMRSVSRVDLLSGHHELFASAQVMEWIAAGLAPLVQRAPIFAAETRAACTAMQNHRRFTELLQDFHQPDRHAARTALFLRRLGEAASCDGDDDEGDDEVRSQLPELGRSERTASEPSLAVRAWQAVPDGPVLYLNLDADTQVFRLHCKHCIAVQVAGRRCMLKPTVHVVPTLQLSDPRLALQRFELCKICKRYQAPADDADGGADAVRSADDLPSPRESQPELSRGSPARSSSSSSSSSGSSGSGSGSSSTALAVEFDSLPNRRAPNARTLVSVMLLLLCSVSHPSPSRAAS
jgi:hypothetical protein